MTQLSQLWNPSSEAAMAVLLSPELLESLKSFVLAGTPANLSRFNPRKPNAVVAEVSETTTAWTKTRTNFRTAVRLPLLRRREPR